MSSQEAFLSRVRRALRKEPQPAALRPPLLATDGDLQAARTALQARLLQQRAGLLDRIQRELTAVGGCVVQTASPGEAVQYIVDLAQAKAASLLVRWPSPLLRTLEVDAALAALGIAVHVAEPLLHPAGAVAVADGQAAARRQELRALLAQADLGLSGVDYVIAETGTLVVSAQPGQMRGVSLLPPVHVAVARSEQIVATLADYLLLLRAEGADLQQQLTSCVSFITGPSRTGDIELKLTVGVHGPGEVHLVLLDETRLPASA